MKKNKPTTITRRIIPIAASLFLLSGCVTYYHSEPQNNDMGNAGTSSEVSVPALSVLKKRMSACVIQYAIAMGKNDNISVEFNAEDQRVTYHSAEPDLVAYMSLCAGGRFEGKDKDKGSITISGKGA